ncbi:MAG: DNA polymerase III subunit delta' [Candidatus Aminicenantes bacterium]|nr:DNA polymerase III subunit delta' [Candidatus Aminicenantes bacterium]
MAFKDIAGNTAIKRVLRLALERSRAPHSLIFAGPEGVGKMATALTLAKALNCRAVTADSCDECPSCRAVDNDTHPDVMTLSVEVQKVKAEQTDLLKRMAYLRPMMGKRRVFIIDDAKDMSPQAANSLLKVLEEPPSFTHVILLTDSPHLLLPTIRSRCRLLPFSPIGREEIEENLLRLDFSRDQARILALLVDGNLDRARELDWEEVQALREEAWGLFEALASADRSSLFLERFGTVPKSIQESFAQVLEIFATFARDLLLLRLAGDPALLINPDFEERLREASSSWSRDALLGVLGELDALLVELKRNMNKNLLATAFVANFRELRHV